MELSVYDSPVYKRSRNAYIVLCALEYCISLSLSDAYLTKLLADIGMSDIEVGIVSSLSTVAFLFQLLTILWSGRVRRVKHTVTLFFTVSELFHIALYVIPLLPVASGVKSLLVVLFLGIYFFLKYFISSLSSKWGNSYVSPFKRGEYSAVKEMVSLVVGMVFTLLIGLLMDGMEAQGRLHQAFILNALIGLVCNAGCFMCLTRMGTKETRTDAVEDTPKVTLREIVRETLGRREFINVLILSVLYNIALYLTTGFLGTFKLKELMLTVGTVQVLNIAGTAARFLISKPFGRYSDRTSYAKGISLGLLLTVIGFAFNLFVKPGSIVCILLFTLFYNVSQAGIGQNMFNITYSYVPEKYFIYAAAIKNTVGGICGFIASLAGSAILAAVQANGNMFCGIPMFGQQVQSLLTMAFLLAALLFNYFVVSRQKVMRQ